MTDQKRERTVREDTLEEAAKVAYQMASMYRNGDFGDESTSRDIRDAVEHVGSVLSAMARRPKASFLDILQED